MNFKQHTVISIIIAVIIGYFFRDLIVYVGFIVLGALLPDIIEPPRSPFHRKFFHSRLFFKLLFLGLIILFIASLNENKYYWAFFLVLGYLTHLIFDAIIPKGLPKR
jgi:inner membrane protein